jgi:hypothetical protein
MDGGNLIQIRGLSADNRQFRVPEDPVANDELPRDADVEQVNSQLSEGLKTCRSVVANYRMMLTGESGDNDNDLGDSQLYGGTEYGDGSSDAQQG